MRRNWYISLFACLILVLGLGAIAAQAQEKKIVMRIGCIATPPQPQSLAAEEFKKLVEAKVGDRLDVQVYHASQLGTIPQHLQGLQNGSVHAIFMPCGFQATVVPEIDVLNLPFFFPSSEWVYQMFNKGYVQPLYDAMQAKGLVFLSTPPAPDREIFISVPVKTLADFAGKRIRTYSSPINQKAISLMGFTSVNIDSSEMSVAIQQGTVDGIETDKSFWYAMKLFKAQYSLDFYKGSIVHMSTISKRWFDPLPEDIKQAIIQSCREMAPLIHDNMTKVLLPKIMSDPAAKLTVLPVTPEMVATLKERTLPVHDQYRNMGPSFQKTYDYYKDLIAKYPDPADAPDLWKK